MISVRGLSLETATRRMGLRIECVVVVCEMREFMELRAERRCVVRAGEGFMASAVWEEVDGVTEEVMVREWNAAVFCDCTTNLSFHRAGTVDKMILRFGCGECRS